MTKLSLVKNEAIVIYKQQFAHMIDELYTLDAMSDHRWAAIRNELDQYSFESLERLAKDLRHDLTIAWNTRFALVDGHFIERNQMRKVA